MAAHKIAVPKGLVLENSRSSFVNTANEITDKHMPAISGALVNCIMDIALAHLNNYHADIGFFEIIPVNRQPAHTIYNIYLVQTAKKGLSKQPPFMELLAELKATYMENGFRISGKNVCVSDGKIGYRALVNTTNIDSLRPDMLDLIPLHKFLETKLIYSNMTPSHKHKRTFKTRHLI